MKTSDSTSLLRPRLRGTADRALQALQEEEKVAKELEENNRRAAERTQQLEDKLALVRARTAGGTKQQGELFELLEQQRQERRGVTGKDLSIIEQTQQFEQLALMQKQYDDTFGKIKTQAEGVFDAIFTRGRKGFAGLLDYIKGVFVTGLKDAFGTLVATLFAGPRPGGARSEGGLLGAFSSLFGGNRGGGGGFNLGGFGFGGGGLGGGGGFASRLRTAFGFGGAAIPAAGFGAGAAGLGSAAATLTPGVAAALATTFTNTGLTGAGTAAGGAGAGGSFFGLSGAQLGAFFTNPFTIAAGIGIAATIAYLKLRKNVEDKFRDEILRDFAIDVPDKKLLGQIKKIGEMTFGKDADRKRFETLRLDSVQSLLMSFATASGQDPSLLPLYQRFFGKGGIADHQRLNIAKMAMGGAGIVTQPTLFLAGEAGPEAYAFQPKDGQSMLGGVSITYAPNVVVHGGDPKEFAAQLERHGRELVRQVSLTVGRDIGRTQFRQALFGQ